MGVSSTLLRELKRAMKETEQQMIKAEVAALNRAAATALARTIRFIRMKYKIKLQDIKPYTTLIKANKNKRSVQIRVKGQAIPLYKFGAKVMGKTSKKRGHVVATEQVGKRKAYKGAFIATGPKYGKEAVFIRKGKERGPIRELLGPSAMALFTSEQAEKELELIFRERFQIEMDRAINHFVK